MATSSETPHDVEYQYLLRNNENKIANLINLTCLLPLLRAKGLLTENECKLLEEMSPETQHNRINARGAQLVQILLGKEDGRNVLNVFIEALREEKEHMGHKSLAFELLAELSKLPPPPSLFRPRRAATLPQISVRSEVKGQHSVPKHTPLSTRSFSESEGSTLAMGHGLYPQESEQSDSSQQHLDNVHHLRHMSKKLQRTLASQHNTMQTVCHLAKVIGDMQEKMSTMQHLLSVLLDNNQKSSGIYTTVRQNRNYEIKRPPSHCNEYVDSPFFTHADTDSVNSFTNKLDTGVHQILQMNQEEAVMCIQLDYLLPELRKRRLVSDFEFQYLSDKSSTPEEKNRFLMHIIESKGGEKSFDLFIQALEAELQHTKHKHLAKVLRDAKAVLINQIIFPPKLPPKPQKDPVPEYMTVSNTNCDSSDGLFDYAGAIKSRIQVRFVEEEKLADGKNGEVWLAFDKKEGTKVIIKKPITTEIFMQEKYVLANIRHANVIRLMDSSMTESCMLVFEYAVNGNLRNYLKSFANSFSISKLLVISTDVACGMSELEKRAIIHCDVKAKSVLIDNHFVCKIASFSKAHCLKPGKSSYIPLRDLTITIATKWAAPEILSERKFSIKSDVWAFGVFLSEVFSQGSTPYPNMDNATVKSNVQNGIKMAQPSDCPEGVYEVMKGCFEFHAENRPSFPVVHQQLMELHCKNSMSEASNSGSYIEDL